MGFYSVLLFFNLILCSCLLPSILNNNTKVGQNFDMLERSKQIEGHTRTSQRFARASVSLSQKYPRPASDFNESDAKVNKSSVPSELSRGTDNARGTGMTDANYAVGMTMPGSVSHKVS